MNNSNQIYTYPNNYCISTNEVNLLKSMNLAWVFYRHLQLTSDEVSARLKKDYPADIKAYDMVQKEILNMSQFFVDGIVRQFPDLF